MTASQLWTRCYLGLGSNLANEIGSPLAHLQLAIAALKANSDFRSVIVSSFYRSAPMGPQDQPDFVNAVVELETQLSPMDLLDACQALETKARRERLRHWGERSLDVDVLLYGDDRVNEPRLTVPHPGIFDRSFVLVPLAEIAPNLILSGQPIQQFLQRQNADGLTRINEAKS